MTVSREIRFWTVEARLDIFFSVAGILIVFLRI